MLVDCSFKVAKGETFIICGGPRSGKSTILNLIYRFYDVSQGRILLDDKIDLRIINPEWLRRVIGIIPQTPIFLNGSIKENIILSLPKCQIYSESKVIEASKKVIYSSLITG